MIKKLWIFTFLLFSTTFIYGQNFQRHIDYSKFYGLDFNENICALGFREQSIFSNHSLVEIKKEKVFGWKFYSWWTIGRSLCYSKITGLNYDQWVLSKKEAGLDWDEISILMKPIDKIVEECIKDIDIDNDFFGLFVSGPDWSGGRELMFATESIDITGLWHDEVCKTFPGMLILTKSWDSESDFLRTSEAELNEIIAVLKKTYGDPHESSTDGTTSNKWNFSNHTLICSRSTTDKKIKVYYVVGNVESQ